MADSSVIKEFLVALGFKTDEAALKKFAGGIEQATKVVFGLAAAVEATAITVSIGVAKFANNLEQLYFASQRTGASVTGLKAFGRAALDFGASAQDAQQAAENFAGFMRNNPMGEAFLHGIGVGTRDAQGGMRDTVDIMMDFGKFLASKPNWLANQYAKMFGIPDNLALALRNPGFAGDLQKIFAELKKAGFLDAAAQAHRFMTELRKLGDQLTIFGTQIENALQKKLKISIEGITAWFQANGPALADQIVTVLGKLLDQFNTLLRWTEEHWPQISKFVSDALAAISRAIDLMKPAVEWVYAQLVNLDSATDGWSTKILALTAALKLLGAGGILSGVIGLTAAFGRLGVAIAGASTAGGALAAIGGGLGLGYLINKISPDGPLAKIGQAFSEKLFEYVHRRDLAMLTLTNMGWSHEQAAGIVANLQAESGLIPAAVGDDGEAYGIAQWHKAGQKRFKDWAGHDIHDSTRDEQLAFLNYDMRQGGERQDGQYVLAAQTARQAAINMSLMYERPAGGYPEAQRRGDAAMQISSNNNTVIHVNGGDPASTARHIADDQERVARNNAAALVREFSQAGL